ncbi:MAG: fimbria major subunit [Alistipes sp.]|nr:fimbria major subunit [Alistipes sp.]
MKKNLLWSVILLMTGAIVWSCNNDKDGPGIPEGSGNVQLLIKDYQMNKMTRAASGTEAPVTGESELADHLDILVLNNTGQVEFNGRVPVNPATGLTSAFTVMNGDKTFFVYSNRLTDGITWPTVGVSTMSTVDGLVANVSFNNNVPDIAKSGEFTIHHLWDGDAVLIDGSGTLTNPQHVDVKLGRAAAKINLRSVTHERQGVNTLPGSFTPAEYQYTLKSVPTKYYYKGRYTPPTGTPGALPPYAGMTYESAVHNDPQSMTASYTNYTMGNPVGTPFYAVENTTAPVGGEIFHGNTTYISLRTKYTPDATEIYTSANPDTPGGTLDPSGTFWLAIHGTTKKLFGDNPSAVPGIDPLTIEECTNGIMYYYIPVKDPSEEGLPAQCCVIRNHKYDVSVLSISGYGSGKETEDIDVPIKELEKESWIEVQVEVLDWYHVEDGVDL